MLLVIVGTYFVLLYRVVAIFWHGQNFPNENTPTGHWERSGRWWIIIIIRPLNIQQLHFFPRAIAKWRRKSCSRSRRWYVILLNTSRNDFSMTVALCFNIVRYYLYNLIVAGDLIEASTVRNVSHIFLQFYFSLMLK